MAAKAERHDVYVEIAGRRRPTCTTISSSAGTRPANAPRRRRMGPDGSGDRPFPARLSAPRRREHRADPGARCKRAAMRARAGRGAGAHASPAGERAILEQYLGAIGAARRSIYIENQAIPVPEIAVGWKRPSGAAWKSWLSSRPSRIPCARARLQPGAKRFFAPSRRSAPSKFCARRDCGPGCGRAAQHGLRP